eukprot:g2178.t1
MSDFVDHNFRDGDVAAVELMLYLEIVLTGAERSRIFELWDSYRKSFDIDLNSAAGEGCRMDEKGSHPVTVEQAAFLRALATALPGGRTTLLRAVDEIRNGCGRAVVAGFGALFPERADEKISAELRGDQLFLAHKLSIALRNAAERSGERAFEHLYCEHVAWLRTRAEQWASANVIVPFDTPKEIILNIVEGVHVLQRLGMDHIGTRTIANSRKESSRSIRRIRQDTEGSTRSSGRPQRKCRKVRLSYRDDDDDDGGGDSDVDDTGDENGRINYNRVSEIMRILEQYHVSDVLGFDPCDKRDFPLTSPRECSHCATTNRAGATCCVDCHSNLRETVDWGSLTDALVWLYLFEDMGVELTCVANANRQTAVTMNDVLRHLHRARRYFSIDEIGHNDFVLECYYITHMLYVVSDWGSAQLPSELFAEEYRFLVENLPRVVHMGDAEIVGEFVHCLRIFGVVDDACDDRDPNEGDLARMALTLGVEFLIDKELKHGSKGSWVGSKMIDGSRTTKYDRYHAAYCGVVGLLWGPPPHHTKVCRDAKLAADKDVADFVLCRSSRLFATVGRKQNPKRGKSHARYERYKAANNVQEFFDYGGTRADFRFDMARKYVTIETGDEGG